MSLGIDIAKVSGVLLHDGWHLVEAGSFSVDLLYVESPDNTFTYAELNAGFRFMEKRRRPSFENPNRGDIGGAWISGPLTSILAYREQSEEAKG